jgi:hypothetical protein
MPPSVLRATKGEGSDIFGLEASPEDLRLEGVPVMLESLECTAAGGGGFEAANLRVPAIQGCRKADAGLSLRSGSQARHFAMKSTN